MVRLLKKRRIGQIKSAPSFQAVLRKYIPEMLVILDKIIMAQHIIATSKYNIA